jgi:hypothetical protein
MLAPHEICTNEWRLRSAPYTHMVIGGKANGRRSEIVDVIDGGARTLHELFNAAEIWVKRKGRRNGQAPLQRWAAVRAVIRRE